MNKNTKRILKAAKKNYLLLVFVIIIFFVAVAVLYKNFFSSSQYFYAKVRVDYPASYYSKPDIWLTNSLRAGDRQSSLLGGSSAEILKVRYYPISTGNSSSNFNIFLTLRMEGSFDKKTKTFTFQRSNISTGSPITFNFSSAQIEGTVIDLSQTPFADSYIDKTVTLIWRAGYSQDFPYFYSNINVGDKYYDGSNYVFEILDKHLENNVLAVPNYVTGQIFTQDISTIQNIVLTAKVKVLERDNQFIFAGDQVLKIGNNLNISTQNFDYNNFIISNIQ
jgi:hypothetical protein